MKSQKQNVNISTYSKCLSKRRILASYHCRVRHLESCDHFLLKYILPYIRPDRTWCTNAVISLGIRTDNHQSLQIGHHLFTGSWSTSFIVVSGEKVPTILQKNLVLVVCFHQIIQEFGLGCAFSLARAWLSVAVIRSSKPLSNVKWGVLQLSISLQPKSGEGF